MPNSHPFCGPVPLPGTLASAWTLEPALLAGLTLAGILGLWRLRTEGASTRRHHALAAAAAGSLLAFVSPLCALTVAFFAARTAHHLVLLFIIAPALAMAFPWRRAPLGPAFVILSAALWAWHLPGFYAAAWDSTAVYWTMQAALLLPGWALWAAVLARRHALDGALTAAGTLTGLAGQMGLIGAVLVFAPRVLYPEHLAGAEAFGLSALTDQQLGGLVMWVPGMLPLALVAAWLLQQGWRTAARA